MSVRDSYSLRLLATLLTIDSASMFVTPAGPSAVRLGGQPANVSIPTQQDLTFLALGSLAPRAKKVIIAAYRL